ncbi:ubiquinol oxidase subunit II [uncultured Aureimonas sp.]|uniref:ubiquinol oxidase subunit II n=1 Tax=uncultured Aureimonas sp. TaxID=1604662 RepID=UPI0025E8D298|nr:ubiquinol oxidase subunit II [uncultured Aureimonas sp.]
MVVLLQRSLRALAVLPLLLILGGCNLVVMNPSGFIANQQANLILISTGLMLLIIVPVITATLWFAWRYRASNPDAKYDGDWHHSTRLEVLIWTAPLMIIIALGAVTWISTHLLDPYRPLDRIDAVRPVTAETPPITVEVVALDWKWMFFYPEYGIATVNELAAPVDRPINFKITSSAIMNTFYVPALAGMIYAMPGMETKLHAVINKPGVYEGMSANYSGAGFSNMHFKFHGLAQGDFDAWVEKVRSEGQPLDRARYLEVEKPSEAEPVHYYSSVEDGLYKAVLNMCTAPGKMCMDEMMHIDMQGGAGVESAQNRDRLIYDGHRNHDGAGHGPEGYAGASGGSEAQGATFPASGRQSRSQETPDGVAPMGSSGGSGHEGHDGMSGMSGMDGHEGHGASSGGGEIAPNQLNQTN